MVAMAGAGGRAAAERDATTVRVKQAATLRAGVLRVHLRHVDERRCWVLLSSSVMPAVNIVILRPTYQLPLPVTSEAE